MYGAQTHKPIISGNPVYEHDILVVVVERNIYI